MRTRVAPRGAGPFAGDRQRAVRYKTNSVVNGFHQIFAVQVQRDVFVAIDGCIRQQTVCQQGNGAAGRRNGIILQERLQRAEEIKRQVEAWMLTIPQRMQRIIRYRVFEELSWNEVAIRMGRKATADSVRMEYTNFMKSE